MVSDSKLELARLGFPSWSLGTRHQTPDTRQPDNQTSKSLGGTRQPVNVLQSG